MTNGSKRVSNTSSQSGNKQSSNSASSRKRTSSQNPSIKQDSPHASFYIENDPEQTVFNFENVPKSCDSACSTTAKLLPRGASISDFHHAKYSQCARQQSTYLNTSQTTRKMVDSVHCDQNSNTNVKTAFFHESTNELQRGDYGYLTPIHCENSYSSILSVPNLYAYVQEEQGIRPSSLHGVRSGCPLSICDNSLAFYKKGFNVMCVINLILILLICIGLPFVYTWTHLQSPPTQQPTTTRATPNADSLNRDISCRQLRDLINISAYIKLLQNNVLKPKNGVCRIESTLDLIKILKETTAYRLPNSTDPCVKCNIDDSTKNPRFLMVAKPAYYAATGYFTDTNGNDYPLPHYRVQWMQEPSPNLGFDDINEVNRSLITIPKTGHYFIFSRIHYNTRPQHQTMDFEFNLGHSVVQVRHGREDLQLAEVSQKCSSRAISADHTSSLETIKWLSEGEKLYVRLSHPEMFDETDRQHTLGMILVN